MEALKIEVSRRDVGKKAAHAVRREGNVPCVLYGHHTEPIAFQVPELVLNQLVYSTEMRLVRVSLDGDSWDCVMKNVDFHPVTDSILHADFQAIAIGEKLTVTVPIRFVGTPIGQRQGGTTRHVLHELEVRCLPKDLPPQIEINVEELHIGDAIHISDLSYPNLKFEGAPTDTVVAVVQSRVSITEEPEELADEEPAEEEVPAS